MHNNTLRRILRVIAYGGAALTAATAPACGDDGASTVEPAPKPELPKVVADALVCPPPDPTQIAGCGPLCDNVACYTSDDGACLDAQTSRGDITERVETERREAGGWFYHESVVSLRGPYDAESSRPFTTDTGDCCYIITHQYCTGRPLTCGDGEVRVAPVVEGMDWV